jgi:hypothetical protein
VNVLSLATCEVPDAERRDPGAGGWPADLEQPAPDEPRGQHQCRTGRQEYAVTLNLSLSPYATRGRLPELNSYLAEMLSDPDDSFLRYLTILDEQDAHHRRGQA